MSSISIVCDVLVHPDGETRPLEFAVIPRAGEFVYLPSRGIEDPARCEIIAINHWPNEVFARHSAKVVVQVKRIS